MDQRKVHNVAIITKVTRITVFARPLLSYGANSVLNYFFKGKMHEKHE